jgi:hypothetical protein
MSDTTPAPEPPYHLFLDADEVPVANTAMRLLISDEAHQPRIRDLAREVIDGMQGTPDDAGKLTVTLDPEQMKIVHTAVGLLFNDLQRGQTDEREILRGILNKLPDEHTIRAIAIE